MRRCQLEAGGLEIGLDRLEDALRVRHVRPGHVGRIAEVDGQLVARQAGLGDQRLGLLRRRRSGGPRPWPRRSSAASRCGDDGEVIAAVERVDQVLAVDRVADGLADLGIVERLVGLVHPEVEEVAALAALDDLQGRVALHGRDVGRVHDRGQVDVTGLERVQRRGRIGDLDELDCVEVGDAVRVPVGRILGDQDVIGRLPLGEHERTGPDHRAGRAGAIRALRRIRIVRIELLERGRAIDPERRDGLAQEERRVRLLELDDRLGRAGRRAGRRDWTSRRSRRRRRRSNRRSPCSRARR